MRLCVSCCVFNGPGHRALLLFDCIFTDDGPESAAFHRAPQLTTDDVQVLVRRIRHRVERLLVHESLLGLDADAEVAVDEEGLTASQAASASQRDSVAIQSTLWS